MNVYQWKANTTTDYAGFRRFLLSVVEEQMGDVENYGLWLDQPLGVMEREGLCPGEAYIISPDAYTDGYGCEGDTLVMCFEPMDRITYDCEKGMVAEAWSDDEPSRHYATWHGDRLVVTVTL